MRTQALRFQPGLATVSLVVAGAIVGLFTVDRVLARVERTEIESEAQSQYREGMARVRRGDNEGALSLLRRAHALERTRREYSLGLVEGLAAADAREEAESRVRDVLLADSNDGRANLLLARLLANSSRTDEAAVYYRRSIYGTWRGDAGAEALNVRKELAEYLARVHRTRELLSELLLLQEAAAKDPALQREVAGLFLTADAGARAAEVYRDLLRRSPGDRDAYRGLGEAELLEGNYRGAEAMFLAAMRSDPRDRELQNRLQFANALALRDPTPRQLSSRAKYERAGVLVQAVRQELERCGATVDAASEKKPQGAITNEMAEEQLELAERLWMGRPRVCALLADDTTAIIMRKLRQTQ